MKKIIILLLLLIIAGWQFLSRTGEVTLGPGVFAKEDPYQKSISLPISHRVNDYIVTEVAEFRIKAKVLSKENYYRGTESDLSPTDLALGWGNMSDENVLEKIKISQSGRFYFWRVESFPIPRKEIESHSANMHIIPANELAEDELKDISKGDIIEISGSLVNISSDDGTWRWRSSLTRNDTGNGACEIFFAKSIEIVTP